MWSNLFCKLGLFFTNLSPSACTTLARAEKMGELGGGKLSNKIGESAKNN